MKTPAHKGDFLHHLHDTIVLLGGDKEIARLLIDPCVLADIGRLRQYNIGLLEQVKDRLASINKIKIRTGSKRRQ